MSLRVIAGSARGRRLRSVPGDLTRPITDRVKEALFNVIGADVVDSAWWDMFAGTGAVGIEALSRGAAFARFTDLAQVPVETIQANLAATHLGAQGEVRRGDAFTLMRGRPDREFQYVYIAPPQYQDLWWKALTLLDENSAWCAPDAWVIVQIAPKEYRAIQLTHLQEFDQRKYGNTLLVYFERMQP